MTFRQKLNRIIFGSDTPLGKWFDIVLIFFIVLSVVAVMLDSVQKFDELMGHYLNIIEWFVTIVFTIEFCLRLYCSQNHLSMSLVFLGL